MGLDMYLYARGFASQYYDPCGLHEQIKPLLQNLPGEDTYYIQKQVAYWRKANQIHAWFVDNVQNGVDECQDSYVDREQLQVLRTLCVELLGSRDVERAKEQLPPRQGFFFGGYEIDEYYWEDLQDTVNQLTPVLTNPNLEHFDFIYHSSW